MVVHNLKHTLYNICFLTRKQLSMYGKNFDSVRIIVHSLYIAVCVKIFIIFYLHE